MKNESTQTNAIKNAITSIENATNSKRIKSNDDPIKVFIGEWIKFRILFINNKIKIPEITPNKANSEKYKELTVNTNLEFLEALKPCTNESRTVFEVYGNSGVFEELEEVESELVVWLPVKVLVVREDWVEVGSLIDFDLDEEASTWFIFTFLVFLFESINFQSPNDTIMETL